MLATGVLQAHKQVDVGAQVSGQLKMLRVKLGEQVKKDQWLAQIDPVLMRNALRQAEASEQNLLAQRRAVAAQLFEADHAYRRQQQMLADDATARQDAESAQAQSEVEQAGLASLDAQIKAARIQVETAQADLAYTRIVAPMDGEVVAIVTQEGQTVIAQQEAPVILKLADLDVMTVKAQVSEADVIHVQPGQQVYFTILGEPDKRYYGRLRALEPAPQASSGESAGSSRASAAVYYNALFDVPNADHRLRISMTAQSSIVLATVHQALAIPLTALGAKGGDGTYAVRVLATDGTVHTRNVRTGINNAVSVEVRAGLKEGEQVIIGDAADNSDADPASAGGK